MIGELLVVVTLAAPGSSTLDRMRSWVGDASAVAGIAGYDATADCSGPRGRYRTRIALHRSDGWARFTQWKDGAQSWDSVVVGRTVWEWDEGDHWNSSDDAGRARNLGHQFLWMVLFPDEVFHSFGEPRAGTLDGTRVEWIPALDTAGHAVELAVEASGRPRGLRVEHGGTVGTLIIRWSSWNRVKGVRLPFAVEIAQGGDRYRFRFRHPQLHPPADAGWTPP
jgi:hypothetical protein